MGRDDSRSFLAAIVAVTAIGGVVLAVIGLATPPSPGGWTDWGMHGDHWYPANSGPSPLWWVLLVASLASFLVAAGVLIRGRALRPAATSPPPAIPAPASAPEPAGPAFRSSAGAHPASADEGLTELTLMKVLNGDERRIYLEVRGHGGVMTQKDLAGLGMFSKAKVSRVLDRLEAKGIVVRERNGMTNRVRIVAVVSR